MLWLLPWWALAPRLVIVNTSHLLEFRKESFKVTLYWLATVGKFLHRISLIQSSNSLDSKSVMDIFHSYVYWQDLSTTLNCLNWRRPEPSEHVA